jgi:hypothetical protein
MGASGHNAAMRVLRDRRRGAVRARLAAGARRAGLGRRAPGV